MNIIKMDLYEKNKRIIPYPREIFNSLSQEDQNSIIDNVDTSKLIDWNIIYSITHEYVDEVFINNEIKLVCLTKNYYIKIQTRPILIDYKFVTDLIPFKTSLLVPKTLVQNEINGYHYIVTERIHGKHLTELNQQFYDIREMINKELKKIKVSRMGTITKNGIIPNYAHPMINVNKFDGFTYKDFVKSRCYKNTLHHLVYGEISFYLQHGDIQPQNIILCDNKIYVVDWEFCAIYPEYVMELIMSLQYEHKITTKIPEIIRRIEYLIFEQ
jgi:Phosphotransferase enzyme family